MALLLLTSSCTPSQFEHVSTGEVQQYRPGLPGFTLSAFSAYEEGETPSISIVVNIPRNNLIFTLANRPRYQEKQYRAVMNLTYRIAPKQGDRPPKIYDTQEMVWHEQYEETQTFDEVQLSHRTIAVPGAYDVTVELTDRNTGERYTRTVPVEVADLREDQVVVSAVKLYSKRQAMPFRLETSYHLPDDIDSLYATIQLGVPSSAEQLKLRMNLLRYQADDLPAAYPHDNTPNYRSLYFKGVNFDKADTLQSTLRRLDRLSGLITVDFPLPVLEPGKYRLEVLGEGVGSEQIERRARDFSIMYRTFPRVTRLVEMVGALKYITYPDEYEQISSIDDPDSLRHAFDRFWVKTFKNPYQAQRAVKQYYERVEMANRYFTNYKAGWKTDRGMIYIVFGEPTNIERTPIEEIWHYPSDINSGQGPDYFVFQTTMRYAKAPYKNFILQRSFQYEWMYKLAIERWRDGYYL